ncbi:hypothetical protein MIR68_009618 [Amoeboaphelidium protococcarum]|nr:hypothetical protein MIR68_009618 [Amoeboaphelidium protococcarum]
MEPVQSESLCMFDVYVSEDVLRSAQNLAREHNYRGAVKHLQSAVAGVVAHHRTGELYHGSAFLFSQKLYLLTCLHVVESADRITVKFNALKQFEYEAEIVHQSSEYDLAVLKLSGYTLEKDHNLMSIVLARDPEISNCSLCAGMNSGGSFDFTAGTVIGRIDQHQFFVSNVTIDGQSGAPCTDYTGQILYGMIKETFGLSHLKTSVITASDVVQFLNNAPPEIPRMRMQ